MQKNLYEYALPVSRLQPRRHAAAAGDLNRFAFLHLDLPFHAAANRAGLLILQPSRPAASSTAKTAIAFPAGRVRSGRVASYPVNLRYNFADFLSRHKQPELGSGERYDTLYQPSEVAAALLPRTSRR